MKNIKFRCLLLMIALAMTAALAGPVYAAESTAEAPLPFTDVSENFWARRAIDNWSGRDVITGYAQRFRPDDSLTRAEMMTILAKVFGYSEETVNPFCDVQKSDWYYGAVIKACAEGVLLGDSDGNGNRVARPDDALTRAEAAVLFSRIFSVSGSGGDNTKFSDIQPNWAKEAIYGMEAAGYVNGADGLFNPENNLSRAEAVQMLDNIVKRYIYHPGSYGGDVSGNVVVNTADAVLKDMTISGSLYLTEGIGEGALTLENVTVTGSTYVRGGGAGQISVESCDLGTLVIEKAGIDPDALTKGPSQSSPSSGGGPGDPGGSGGSGDPDDPDDPGGGEIIDV